MAMDRIEHFIPGQPGTTEGMLPRVRSPIPQGVSPAYLELHTQPGDLVVVPYCQDTAVVIETLAADRRLVALQFDPALTLLLEAWLDPLPTRRFDAAVAQLGDTLKHGIPLSRYLSNLYTTSCPACSQPVAADYFLWDRDQGAPVTKQIRCPACQREGESLVAAQDRDRLSEIPVRAMHYHYVLDRLAPEPEGDSLRARMESMLKLYTPRNLYALAELTIKIDSLFPAPRENRALKALLLDCLDRCSSLATVPGAAGRPRGLVPPARFVERNVWQAFEEAILRLRASTVGPVSQLVVQHESEAFLPEMRGLVAGGVVRDLPKLLPPRSAALLLIAPPLLDSHAWSLSYLWAAWLLGWDAAEPLRPILRQRTPDADWFARAMTGSFRALVGLLRDSGRMVLILQDQPTPVVTALLLAASRARLGLTSLVQCGADYRLELAPTLPAFQPSASDPSTESRIRAEAIQAARSTILARGEPTPWTTLQAAIVARLSQGGFLAQLAEVQEEAPSPLDLIARQIEEALASPIFQVWTTDPQEKMGWLVTPSGAARPLCDRVEEAAQQILQDHDSIGKVEFAQALFAQFPGPLTPARELVAVCLSSIGRPVADDRWALRPEDLPDAREADRRSIIEQLQVLGQRLGYETPEAAPFDVAWFRQGRPCSGFYVRCQALLSEVLDGVDDWQGATPHLVLPGGRAALASHKLAHHPLWQRKVDEAGWRFIKYRHVRQLVAQPDVDEYALRTVIGLDPIVEREATQIPLF
jgi:hypothetical protein